MERESLPSGKKVRRTFTTTKKTSIEASADVSTSQSTELEVEDVIDPASLAKLDAENKRLRALWAARLQLENQQLRKMLSRFPN